ncbi:MAG: dTDP-4-dehydrorhamnose 3,5-epimerase [Dehalococcoidia bacterium]
MTVTPLAIPDVRLITPVRHGDARGFFSETYNRRALAEHGIDIEFVQDNHSLSGPRGTVRGLHYQLPPFAQDKLLRVVRGAVFDVAVDLRRESPTFGQHVSAVLSADEGTQVLVPAGFAHGFCTLEADTEVIYKVSDYYAPDHDRGITWDDPDLGIEWPVGVDEAVLSDRDRRHPAFRDATDLF